MGTDTSRLEQLIAAALGEVPLDLVVRGATLVNVFTRERYPADVGVAYGRIVFVGDLPADRLDSAGETLDWSGRYLLPGFVDPHFHIGGSQLSMAALAEALLPRGTTTIVSDLQEIYGYSGLPGVRFILDEALESGLRVFLVPSGHMLGLERRGRYAHAVSADEMETMLDWPEAVGINEPPPVMVLGRNPGSLQVVAGTRARRLVYPGHAAGVQGLPLQAYAAAGASSDHESQAPDEALEKLRLGLWPIMREGSAAVDLENLLPLLRSTPGAIRWAMVGSDEQDAPEIVEIGNIDNKLRIVVRNGFDPMDAIPMGTVNPALYYRIDHLVGSVTPGKSADLVAVRDLESFEVTDVVAQGRVVVRDRELLHVARPRPLPDFLVSQVNWPRPLVPGDFAILAAGAEARVRVIGVTDGSLVSDRREATLRAVDGRVEADQSRDILKMAVIDRHSGEGTIGLGFIQGLGLVDGALASTYCHVHYNALVIGTSDEQMALAGNELAELGGGVVVLSGREALMRWRLPLVGVFSTEPLAQAQADLAATNDALKRIGCTFSSPILGLSFVALTTIPEYGMTELGLFDVETAQFVPCVIS